MTPLRQRTVEDMKIRRFSPQTQDRYVPAVEKLRPVAGPVGARGDRRVPRPTQGRCTQLESDRPGGRSRLTLPPSPTPHSLERAVLVRFRKLDP